VQVADLYAGLSVHPDEGAFHKASEMLEGLKHGLEAVAAFEIGKKIVEFFTETFKGAQEAGIGAERLGQKIGVTMQGVQELGYAAKVTGVSTEEMQIAFTHLARGLEEAKKGTGPTHDALVALKIPMEAIKNASPDEVLAKLADKFAEMPDGAKKTALAMDIFGKSGANLIPLLNRGGDGIAALRKEAEELGIVIDEKTAKSFEDLEETQNKISASWQGLKNTLAIALLPTIKEVAEAIFEWVKAHREVIASGIKAFVEGLVNAFHTLGDVVSTVIDFVKENHEVFEAIGDVIGFLIDNIKILAGIVVAPFALMFAAVYGTWKAILYFKDHAIGAFRAIGNFVEKVVTGIKDGFLAAFDFVRNLPVVKQLFDLVEALTGLTDIGKAADTSHEKALQDSVTMTDAQWKASHPELAGYDLSGAAAAYDAAYSPTVSPRATGGSGTNNTTVNSTMNITSPNADPKQVADEAVKAFQQFWNGKMLNAHAATGGADQ
jgi:hypothetical protein